MVSVATYTYERQYDLHLGAAFTPTISPGWDAWHERDFVINSDLWEISCIFGLFCTKCSCIDICSGYVNLSYFVSYNCDSVLLLLLMFGGNGFSQVCGDIFWRHSRQRKASRLLLMLLHKYSCFALFDLTFDSYWRFWCFAPTP